MLKLAQNYYAFTVTLTKLVLPLLEVLVTGGCGEMFQVHNLCVEFNKKIIIHVLNVI